MLNHIDLMGRLTRDPELKRTTSGTAVTSFSIACDRDFRDQDGNRPTDYIDIVAWRGTAEFVCNNFAKGRMIAVDGRLHVREWKDKDGNNRKSAEVVADHVYFADSKKDSALAAPAAPSYDVQSPGDFAEIGEDEGSLPF